MKGPEIRRLYYSTKEISRMAGISPQMLRMWESRFSELKPLIVKGGRRLYRPDDLEIVMQIKQLYERGLSQDEISMTLKRKDKMAIEPEETIDVSDEKIAYSEKSLLSEIYHELEEILKILNE